MLKNVATLKYEHVLTYYFIISVLIINIANNIYN